MKKALTQILAYLIYLIRGRRENRALDDWLMAERFTTVILKNLLLAVIIGAMTYLFAWLPSRFYIPYWWILGFIAFVISLCALLRPKNIQTVAIIGFLTLMLNGLGVLGEKENFELRNRPYIQIVDSSLKIFPTKIYRLNGPKPEPAFLLELLLANHGPVPASVRKILIKGHAEIDKVTSEEGVSIGPNAVDKEKQWKNFDIFPKFSEQIANIWPDWRFFYFNVGDVRKLFGMELDESEITKSAQPSPSGLGLYNSPYLLEHAKKIASDFFVIIQLEYNALGERNKKAPYYYWVIYKIINGSDPKFVESGINCRLSCKK